MKNHIRMRYRIGYIAVLMLLMVCLIDIPAEAKGKTALSAKSIRLTVGQSYTLTLKNPPKLSAKQKKAVKWTSSKKNVASVKVFGAKKQKCKITAKAAGSSVVKVKYKGKQYSCSVQVSKTSQDNDKDKDKDKTTEATTEAEEPKTGDIKDQKNYSFSFSATAKDENGNILLVEDGVNTATVTITAGKKSLPGNISISTSNAQAVKVEKQPVNGVATIKGGQKSGTATLTVYIDGCEYTFNIVNKALYRSIYTYKAQFAKNPDFGYYSGGYNYLNGYGGMLGGNRNGGVLFTTDNPNPATCVYAVGSGENRLWTVQRTTDPVMLSMMKDSYTAAPGFTTAGTKTIQVVEVAEGVDVKNGLDQYNSCIVAETEPFEVQDYYEAEAAYMDYVMEFLGISDMSIGDKVKLSKIKHYVFGNYRRREGANISWYSTGAYWDTRICGDCRGSSALVIKFVETAMEKGYLTSVKSAEPNPHYRSDGVAHTNVRIYYNDGTESYLDASDTLDLTYVFHKAEPANGSDVTFK